MLDYNEIYVILNTYLYDEKNMKVYNSKNNTEIVNINDILKIKSAFFINEYYKNECSKIVQKRPGSKIRFKEEFYKNCIDKLYTRLFIEKFESNESSFTESADEDWIEFLYKHKDIGTAYLRFFLRNSGKDLENIQFKNVFDEAELKVPTVIYKKVNFIIDETIDKQSALKVFLNKLKDFFSNNKNKEKLKLN